MSDYTYNPQLLRIDLTNNEYTAEPIPKSWIKPVIGGRAANTKRLYQELDTDCHPLDPENMLIFGVGPFTGSLLPASSYYTVSAKSPLTGILGDSAAGGQFAAEMKSTGFDQIVITGKADTLVYILVTESTVKFVECPHLKGKTILETTKTIRKEHKNYDIQTASIGPAGENLVLFACIVSSGNRVNGRCGMGAVMGSKNVKAVAVSGCHPVTVKDPLKFLEISQKLENTIKTHPEFEKRHNLGTTMLIKDLNALGILPTNHFLKGVCPYVDNISGEYIAKMYKTKNKGCFNCPVNCSRYYIAGDTEAEGPEFETLCSFTSRIGNDNITFALEMNWVLNQMGLDSISTGEILGWLMECQEKGLLSSEDIGCVLSWGDTNAIQDIVKKIVTRQGIGDILADGSTKASKKFSKKVQDLVMQVKGLDIICGDPRGIKAYGLTYAVASRGADHLRAEPYFELTNRKKEAKARFGTEKAANRLSEEGKAQLVVYSEKISLLCDSLTMCKNIGLCMDVLTVDICAHLLTAGTGIKYTPEYIDTILTECINRDHELNKKFGVKKEDDTLPKRFVNEPLSEGLTKGSTVNISKMVDEYYELHKWK
ncbi:MAG: aldehyde ferredoxin oxidoreductase family protein [Candidatus Methanofastidiosia archaeon]|jgi:aldehyde:ferredoxin oxidoreductase